MENRYQYGHKYVYWSGKIFFGSNSRHVMLALYSLIQPLAVFLLFRYHDYPLDSVFPSNVILVVALEFLTLMFFLTAALTDPGYLGRKNNQSPADEMDEEIIEFKNRNFRSSYCDVCKFHRPLRCHHCRACGVCIEEMDHHCPWMGNCVGRRTRCIFLLFLLCAMSLNAFLLKYSWGNISGNAIETWEVFKSFMSIYEVVHTGLVFIFCFALFLVQIYVISTGVTTVERIKRYWEGMVNPYDEGYVSNWKNFFMTDRQKRNMSFEDFKFLHEERKQLAVETSTITKAENEELHFSLEMSPHKKSLLHS